MNGDDISKTIDNLNEIKLFNHLDQAQISAISDEAIQNNLTSEQLLYWVPDLIYGFDSEGFWGDGVTETYVELINDLRKISRGLFEPINLDVVSEKQEEFDRGDELIMVFELENQSFQYKLEFLGDWLDLSFISKINQAIIKSKIDGQYYLIDTDDQMVWVIFLTKDQFQVLSNIMGSELKNYDELFNYR